MVSKRKAVRKGGKQSGEEEKNKGRIKAWRLICCIGFAWQGFGSGRGYRGGFCEKLLEASPMSDKVNASEFPDRPTAAQGRANQ